MDPSRLPAGAAPGPGIASAFIRSPMLRNPAPTQAHLPDQTGGARSASQGGWTVLTSKQPILPEARMEELAGRFKIEMPTMSFGDNVLLIRHDESKWQLEFTMLGALEAVDKTADKMLKVAHSDSWQKSRQKYAGDILEVVKPFDWSFTNDYKGEVTVGRELKRADGPDTKLSYDIPGMIAVNPTVPARTPRADTSLVDAAPVKGPSAENASAGDCPRPLQFQPSDDPFPLDRLKRPDPISFFDEVPLFEDELADNGLAQLSVKVRIMPDRLLVLQRFYLRLNQVLFRLRDTRICVEFATGEVWREYTAREAAYKPVADKLMSMGGGLNSMLQATWNPDNLLQRGLLPEVEKTLEKVVVKA